MIDVAEPITWVQDQLAAEGIAAAIDPADLNVPGVLVELGSLTRTTFGSWTAAMKVHMLVGDLEQPDVWAQLSPLVIAVAGVFELDQITTETLVLPGAGDGLPGLLGTFNVQVGEDA